MLADSLLNLINPTSKKKRGEKGKKKNKGEEEEREKQERWEERENTGREKNGGIGIIIHTGGITWQPVIQIDERLRKTNKHFHVINLSRHYT